MFCFKCGSQQADDAKFCGVCGTGLATVIDPRAVSPEAPASAPPKLHSPALPEAPVADARLGVEDWSVTCTAPDSDGDVRFEAKVRGEYQGTASAHVARLLWIAFGPSGSIPLLQGDNTLTQDIDDEDSVEIEAGGYGKLGEGVDPAACQVRGQVVLYPGEKQAPWTLSLPEAGQAGGKGPAWSSAGAEIAGWRLTCSESSDESASYTLFILARNTGRTPLAAVTFRVRVKNRKGDVWSTEHLTTERLAPGEMRNVETTLYVSERAKARKGAVVDLTGIVCPLALVHPLAPVVAVFKADDAASDDPETSGSGTDLDDNSDETADENEFGDDGDQPVEETTLSCEPMEDAVMAQESATKSVTWAPEAGKPGDWTFYPNAKLRKDYADSDRDRTGLDCQQGEVLSLIPQKTDRRGKTLIVTIGEGRVELGDFDASWHELKALPSEDSIVWDIDRIVEEWSSE